MNTCVIACTKISTTVSGPVPKPAKGDIAFVSSGTEDSSCGVSVRDESKIGFLNIDICFDFDAIAR